MSFVNEKHGSLDVLIVGCGNIAGKFDEGRAFGDSPYTHAGAYKIDKRFDVGVCVDPDDHRRAEFMRAWNVSEGFRSMNEILGSNYHFDVVSICSPTACHVDDLVLALRLNPKLIFCEKPVTVSFAESEGIVAACRNASVQMAVNYTRRWDPEVSRIQRAICDGQWGELRSVTGIYNKGILNNGSHMLDLLLFLVGPLNVIKVGKPIFDFFSHDPTVPVLLESDQGVPVYLNCANAQDYTIFELQLVFSHGVLTMEEGGMFWRERRAINSETFKGYRVLEAEGRRTAGYQQAMLRAIDNIYGAITDNDSLLSTGESALATQRVCENIKQQACAL